MLKGDEPIVFVFDERFTLKSGFYIAANFLTVANPIIKTETFF